VNGETPDRTPAVDSLTAVIANWNTADYTIRAAAALESDGLPRGRIVVVDNGSTDGSEERLRRELDGCVLVRIEENVGFARASNVGARTLGGTGYLFVNSDAFLHRPGTLARLAGALADERVGIAVPRILNTDLTLQPSVVPLSSPRVALVRASGLSRLVPNRWQPSWSTHWDHGSSREIQAANGAVLLVRASAWDALGGFDERLRMYAEDLDVCWRARRLGWAVRFVHDAEFVHLGGGATGGDWMAPERAERIGVSEGAMIRRHLSPGAARLTLAFMSAGLAGRAAVYRARRNVPAAAAMAASLRGLRRREPGP
jgi:N-acetylglucosaminyl-diphospho-decaprenol L-rhamnosyltransferase